MGLQAIIFDVDGTVAETADLHRAAFNRAFQEHGLDWHWDREIFNQLSPIEFTLPKLRLFAAASRRSGHGPTPNHQDLAAIAMRKAQIYCRSLRQNPVHPRPGVARLIQESIHDGLILGAISTSTRTETQALLIAALGVQAIGWFSVLKTAENALVSEAEGSLYQAVLDDLEISGHHAVAIDDSARGTSAAAEKGLCVVATPSLYTASTRFMNATITVSDLGKPSEPFTVINGDCKGHAYVSPALLHDIAYTKAAAA